MRKRGLSTVIATLLIVMLTIFSAVIIAGLIIPMIKDNMAKSKGCYDVRDSFIIDMETGLTCYNDDSTSVMVKMVKQSSIKGFIFMLSSSSENKRYEVIDGSVVTDEVKMYNISKTEIRIPKEQGEAETYIFDVKADNVKLALVLQDNNVCEGMEEKIAGCQK